MKRISVSVLSGLAMCAAAGAGPTFEYKQRLLPTSVTIGARCLEPCACAPGAFPSATEGTFNMTLAPGGDIPGFAVYTVSNVCWTADGFLVDGRISGFGIYLVSTNPDNPVNRISLTLTLPNGTTHDFDSGLVPIAGAGFPDISIEAEAPQVVCSQYWVRIASTPTCKNDFNADGRVKTDDLVFFLSQFGEAQPRSECSANTTSSAAVTTEDLVGLLAEFGRTCN